jgi:predicted MPP superfamily phosphohydrolase
MTVAFVLTLAIFLGLLLFFVNEIRRPVRVTKWEGRGRLWVKRLRISLISILIFVVGAVGWAFFIEPNRLIVRHETLQMQQWPASLSNLKIAVLSDIHVGSSFIDDHKVRLIVQRTNELQPDLIVILGDYIAGDGRSTPHTVAPEKFAPLLKEFRAPLGVYSVLGNHDWWYDGNRVRNALEANGIRVLENQTQKIDVRGTPLWLAGLADLWTRQPRIHETTGAIPQDGAIIALTHNPDIFPRLPQRVALMIAGHTHGGQIRLPLIGPIVQPSRVSAAYTRGHVFENGHHLFVTTGIGTSIVPVRFGVTPEIVLLTLTSAN